MVLFDETGKCLYAVPGQGEFAAKGEVMGKAYSEEEKKEIKGKLRQVGLQLFREKGIRKVSVREMAAQVGIAQGGFYTFYAVMPSRPGLTGFPSGR